MKVIVQENDSKETVLMEGVDWRELAPFGTHTLLGEAEFVGGGWRAKAAPEAVLLPVPSAIPPAAVTPAPLASSTTMPAEAQTRPGPRTPRKG